MKNTVFTRLNIFADKYILGSRGKPGSPARLGPARLVGWKKIFQTLKWPKIPEDSSDFDDFWSELIVMT